MTGGTGQVNGFHFSEAVVDPLISLFSVGQAGVPVSFNFLNNVTFSILSEGAGNWGGGCLPRTAPRLRAGKAMDYLNSMARSLTFYLPRLITSFIMAPLSEH